MNNIHSPVVVSNAPVDPDMGPPVAADTSIQAPVVTVMDDLDPTRELARISAYRTHEGVHIFADALSVDLRDRPKVKNGIYEFRTRLGMYGAGLSPNPVSFKLTPADQPASLYPQAEAVFRTVFTLASVP